MAYCLPKVKFLETGGSSRKGKPPCPENAEPQYLGMARLHRGKVDASRPLPEKTLRINLTIEQVGNPCIPLNEVSLKSAVDGSSVLSFSDRSPASINSDCGVFGHDQGDIIHPSPLEGDLDKQIGS